MNRPEDLPEFSAEHLALLSRLMEEEGLTSAVRDDGPVRREVEHPPLTHGQEVLWLLDQAAPGLTAYNIGFARRVRGVVDERCLRIALTQLVARHEVLRTVYPADAAGVPWQRVLPAAEADLEVLEFRSGPEAERETAALERFRARAARPMDLAHGPAFGAAFARLADDRGLFGLFSHHIVLDGLSVSVILEELAELYDHARAGSSAALPDHAIRFTDFAIWQREHLAGDRFTVLDRYWREQLRAPLPDLQLPTDRPRSRLTGFRGGACHRELDPGTLQRLRDLARETGTTLYMVLLAAYQTLLHRLSGSEDIIVGSAVAGRSREELERIVGYFANLLPMRTRFDDDPSFRALLDRVRGVCLDAFEHQDFPMERMLDAVGGGAETTLFHAVFTMQEGVAGTLRLGDAELLPVTGEALATKFDITLLPLEQPGSLRLVLQYRADLFDPPTAERMLGHLVTLLHAATEAPDTPVSRLALLSGPERQALAGWNDTAWNEGATTSVTALFEAQAAREPDRIAVRGTDGALTYAELDATANRIAHWLNGQGTGAGTPIGLCLDRSTAMIAGILGVLKAGGVYVPLVPDLPAARLTRQIGECGARAVVTLSAHATRLPSGIPLLCLDRDADALAQLSATRPIAGASPADAAYILFTSGSTGVPKGVTVTHDNIVHYTRAIARVLGLELGDGTAWHFATVSTPGADLGNTAIFPALLSGGTLHVLPADVAMDAHRFAEYAAAHPLDLLKITPNHLRALLDGRDPAEILPQKWLVVGGEACPWDLAETVAAAGKCRMLNHYGPTETTVGVCTFEVGARPGGPESSATVPIGLPLANTRAYILDRRGQETPVGVSGELFIGGRGVTRGYINRAGLTAERFGPDRWSADPDARLYRTGDRVRRLRSGDIEFLGRADDQVKIRGYRVEPGEVEALLAVQDGVRQAAVVARAGADGTQRLVAYVATNPNGSTARLTAALAAQLPEYMIPAAWVRLDALPLNRNGKVDRRALPEPEAAAQPAEENGAPRTDLERQLARLWAEVLKRDAVGIHADFFELGGHSLLAIRVLGRIAKEYGVRLPLRALFDAPTVARLAPLLTESPGTHPAVAIERRARTALELSTDEGSRP